MCKQDGGWSKAVVASRDGERFRTEGAGKEVSVEESEISTPAPKQNPMTFTG